jgi:hypothetical protein
MTIESSGLGGSLKSLHPNSFGWFILKKRDEDGAAWGELIGKAISLRLGRVCTNFRDARNTDQHSEQVVYENERGIDKMPTWFIWFGDRQMMSEFQINCLSVFDICFWPTAPKYVTAFDGINSDNEQFEFISNSLLVLQSGVILVLGHFPIVYMRFLFQHRLDY